MPDNQTDKHAANPAADLDTARLAGFIYGGASAAAALLFWMVTTYTGSYPAVARYGGAAWVFVLMMIVLMPIVIPRVRNRRRRKGRSSILPNPDERTVAT